MPILRKKHIRGFSLVEILVVVSIIAILSSLFISQATGNAQKKARDSKRRADLESIRAALEIYRNDCGSYPATLGSSLTGSGTCAGNTYMNTVPSDPGANSYRYTANGTNAYAICARLETLGASQLCSSSPCTGNCGTLACNYSLCNP